MRVFRVSAWFGLAAFLSLGHVSAQTGSGTYLKQDLSGAFLYEAKFGEHSYPLNNAPGYGINYAFRPVRWLVLEVGLEHIPRPFGASVCCQYVDNAKDQLFLVPFGARWVWESQSGRVRITAGGGGAYLNHHLGYENSAIGLVSASGWGAQAVVSGDYSLVRSGRLRLGVTARYYYIPVSAYTNARLVTVGPVFTYSF